MCEQPRLIAMAGRQQARSTRERASDGGYNTLRVRLLGAPLRRTGARMGGTQNSERPSAPDTSSPKTATLSSQGLVQLATRAFWTAARATTLQGTAQIIGLIYIRAS